VKTTLLLHTKILTKNFWLAHPEHQCFPPYLRGVDYRIPVVLVVFLLVYVNFEMFPLSPPIVSPKLSITPWIKCLIVTCKKVEINLKFDNCYTYQI